tara:strand:- start:10 stop:237 length:228 start_codon:yes stop_codon:yes gene_type:complete
MKEACQYLEEKKARNRVNRMSFVTLEGTCGKFNDKDYKQVKTGMKSSYGAKASAFSRTKLWNHNNLSKQEIKEKY